MWSKLLKGFSQMQSRIAGGLPPAG
jgi:hypothetical protein